MMEIEGFDEKGNIDGKISSKASILIREMDTIQKGEVIKLLDNTALYESVVHILLAYYNAVMYWSKRGETDKAKEIKDIVDELVINCKPYLDKAGSEINKYTKQIKDKMDYEAGERGKE